MTAGLLPQSTHLPLKPFASPAHKTLTPPCLLPFSLSLPSYKSFLSHASSSLRKENRIMTMPMALSGNSSVLIPVDAEKKTTNPIVVIDNYDSFTYNLCQYMGELGCNFEVYRNDELTVDELKKKKSKGSAYITRTRYTPRFRNIITNCIGTWTHCTPVWCLYGTTMHWGGFWREDSAFSLWCHAWKKFPCLS